MIVFSAIFHAMRSGGSIASVSRECFFGVGLDRRRRFQFGQWLEDAPRSLLVTGLDERTSEVQSNFVLSRGQVRCELQELRATRDVAGAHERPSERVDDV